MKQFLAVFTGSKTSAASEKWHAMSEAERQQKMNLGKQGWENWVAKNMTSIVVHGGPLSKTKRVDARGINDISNQMSAFNVVQAESQAAAAEIFLNHPHFMIFPGDGVEIMEIMPIPR